MKSWSRRQRIKGEMRITKINLVGLVFWPLLLVGAIKGWWPWWFVGMMALYAFEINVEFE